ncbi:hypothetical protein AYO21_09533 [Fonsecaea monophora]|uniref:Uncharacterized protein n=1 Tax=Fonsecaea monophora TaxID=254056 RepID=A0A177EY29_9EURO|nr:hypothetical protein AYO21_09533 [Fonsecaea monophora]OAG36291.1 hypothetical protein AYO21_09533 [Fonsecaea monophora]
MTLKLFSTTKEMPSPTLPEYEGIVEDRMRLEESTVDEITPQCCYDVKEVHLDARTLVDLVHALHPIMPSARRCDACHDRPPSSSVDSKVYPKATNDTWQDSSSMWQLVRSELPTETPLSQDLVEILGSWVVAQEMSSLQLARIYRISGGLATDRHKEAMERAGASYMIRTVQHDAEKALFLYHSFDACWDIPWTKVYSMTELGDKKPYASGAQTIVLPSAFDETLTTFQAGRRG